ncbi:MAG: hypothetical protein DCC68_11440 [Planctomycetota bacterium]|nr:MAG: hypothetical protein DCC68_11440 [Planctomycetota bacterium]
MKTPRGRVWAVDISHLSPYQTVRHFLGNAGRIATEAVGGQRVFAGRRNSTARAAKARTESLQLSGESRTARAASRGGCKSARTKRGAMRRARSRGRFAGDARNGRENTGRNGNSRAGNQLCPYYRLFPRGGPGAK